MMQVLILLIWSKLEGNVTVFYVICASFFAWACVIFCSVLLLEFLVSLNLEGSTSFGSGLPQKLAAFPLPQASLESFNEPWWEEEQVTATPSCPVDFLLTGQGGCYSGVEI